MNFLRTKKALYLIIGHKDQITDTIYKIQIIISIHYLDDMNDMQHSSHCSGTCFMLRSKQTQKIESTQLFLTYLSKYKQ